MGNFINKGFFVKNVKSELVINLIYCFILSNVNISNVYVRVKIYLLMLINLNL